MKKTILAILMLLPGAAAPLFASGAPAHVITYQGRLKDNSLPANGNYAFAFDLCDAAATDCYPAPEISQDFLVTNGLFKSTFTLPSVDLSAQEWYLRVSVGGTPLSPMERLTFVPYAVYSSTAGYSPAAVQKSGDFMSGQLTLSGSTLTVTGNEFSVGVTTFVVKNGYVGIGTASPSNPLQVEVQGQYVFAGSAPGAYATINLVPGLGGTARLNNNSSQDSKVALSVGHVDHLVVAGNGNVGISSTTPAYRLSVSSGAGESGNMVVISTGDSNVIRLTGGGEVYATRFIGDGSGITGVTGAVGTDPNALPKAGGTMSGAINMAGNSVYSASTITASGDVTADRYQIWGSTVLAVIGASPSSLLVGRDAGKNSTVHSFNTLVGNLAGSGGPGASFTRVTAVGDGAGLSLLSGSFNSLVGVSAGYLMNSGEFNTVLGALAGYGDTVGSHNVVVGHRAGYFTSSGSSNTLVGDYAGYGASGFSFSDNTVLGANAGYGLNSGSRNILVGVDAGKDITAGNDNIVIGNSQMPSSPAASGEINIGGVLFGNMATRSVGVSTRAPQGALDVYGIQERPVAVFRSTGDVTVSLQSDDTAARKLSLGFNSWSASQSGLRHMSDLNSEANGDMTINTTNAGASSGIERLRITSSGRVGVNYNSPQAKLDVLAEGTAPTDMVQIWRDATGAIVSSVSATGYLQAVKFVGDGSALTGISADLSSPSGTLAVADGGTGGTTPADARANIGAFPSFGGTMTGALDIEVGADPVAFRVGVSTFVVKDGLVGINTSAPAQALEIGAGNIRLPIGQELQWGGSGNSITNGPASGLLVLHNSLERLWAGSNGAATAIGAGDISGVTVDTMAAVHVVAKGLSTGEGRVAVFGDLRSNGSVAGQYLAAGNFETSVDGIDVAEAAIGVRAKIRRENAGAGTVNNAYGVMVDDLQNVSGVIAKTYGVYIGDQTIGTQTEQAYSLYAADPNARSYFAGTVGIGVAAPAYALDISGDMRVAGNVYADSSLGVGTTASEAALDARAYLATPDAMSMILRNSAGTIVSSVSAGGYLQAVKFIGDGSGLTNLPTAAISGLILDAQVALSTGAFPGGFNAADKLVKLDAGGGMTVPGDITSNGSLFVSGNATIASMLKTAVSFSLQDNGNLTRFGFDAAGTSLHDQTGATVLTANAGRVGIGSPSPTSLLHLQAPGPNTANPMILAEDTAGTGEPQVEVRSNGYRGRMSIAGTNGGMYFGTLTPNFLSFQTAGAEWMRLNTQGYLGIGTAAPQHYLHISSNTSSASNTLLKLEDTGTGAPELLLAAGGHQGRMATAASNGGTYFGSVTNDFLILQTNSLQRMRINADGKVGIGEIVPAQALDIASRVQISTYAGGNTDTDGFFSSGLNGIRFDSGGSTYMRVAYGGGNVAIGGSVNSGAGDAKLQVKGSLAVGSSIGGHTGDGLVVQGRVGIGTAAPSGLLEARDITTTGNKYLLVLATGTGSGFVNVSTSGLVSIGYGAPSTNTVLHAQAVASDKTPGVEDVMVGLLGSARAAGTGAEDAAAGGDFMATAGGNDNLGYLVGVHSSVERDSPGSGTVQRAMGVYVEALRNQAGPGGIVDTYGVYIDSQTSGAQTNAPYAVYALDQGARSYFGGKVGIGTASPRFALEVSSAPGSSDQILVVSTGTDVMFGVKGNGEVYGRYFIGNGAGLTNVSANDPGKLPLSGGALVGPLTVSNSSITINSTLAQPFMRLNSDNTFGSVQFLASNLLMGNVGFGNNGGHFIPALPQSMALQAEYGLHLGVGASPLITLTSANKVGVGVLIAPQYSLDVSTANDTDGYVARFGANGIVVSTGGAVQTTGLGDGTVAGGARGGSAVDLQNWRESPDQVASGNWSAIGGGRRNKAFSNYATVSGGDGNTASWAATVAGGQYNSAGVTFATVGGGRGNEISGTSGSILGGEYNKVLWEYGAVGGGQYNVVSGSDSVIAGGAYNTVTGTSAVVAGGEQNKASGMYSGVLGGYLNTASGIYSGVLSGSSNQATFENAVVAGGRMNDASGSYAAIGGGFFNVVQGSGGTSTIAGGEQNIVYTGNSGSAIGGGTFNHILSNGAYETIVGGYQNTINPYAWYSGISGGGNNTIGDYARGSFVGGGGSNRVYGSSSTVAGGGNNVVNSTYAFIGGGSGNTAYDQYSAVAGGLNNYAGATASFVGGGTGNNAGHTNSAIAGGQTNNIFGLAGFVGGGEFHTIDGQYSAVAGGSTNKIRTDANYAFIGGGALNITTAPYSLVGGGYQNTSSGTYSGVLGGHRNEAAGWGAAIAGGELNYAGGQYSFVGAGQNNQAPGNYSAIGGGIGNNTDFGQYSFIGAGMSNVVNSLKSVIGGGENNQILGGRDYSGIFSGQDNSILGAGTNAFIGGGYSNAAQANYATVSGGLFNVASGEGATVAGGAHASAAGQYAMVAGGDNNTALGNYSFAAGNRSSSTAAGTFTWNDSTAVQALINSVPDQVMFKAAGGFWVSTGTVYTDPALYVDAQNRVGIGTSAPGFKLHVKSSIGAVAGLSTSGNSTDAAVYGWSNGAATAIKGVAASGYAGRFEGNVFVTDTGTNPASPAKLQVNGDLGLGSGLSNIGNAPIVIWLRAGAAVLANDAVVVTGDNQVDSASTASDTRIVGVAVEGISAATIGRVAVGGVAVVKCTTGNAGQHAVASGASGAVVGQTNPSSGTSAGMFLSTCGTPAAGQAYMLIGR